MHRRAGDVSPPVPCYREADASRSPYTVGCALNTLILIGASVRAAAFSAVRAGFTPYSIDLFADRDLAAIGPAVKIARYPHDFLPALAAAPQVPWIYTGGLENHARLVDRLAALRPLWGNRGGALCAVRDPGRLSAVAHDAGCQFPETWLGKVGCPGLGTTSIANGLSTGSSGLLGSGGLTLVKPLRSSGGVAIRFAKPRDLATPPRGTYLQQYVGGESASAVFVAAGGQAVLLGATRQLLGSDFNLPRPFLYVGSLGPLRLAAQELSRISSLGSAIAKQFHLAGLFNVDFVRNDAGLWPIEVNPRYSASVEIIERTSETPLIELHAQACESGRLPAAESPAAGGSAGKAVVYAERDGIVPSELDDLVGQWNRDSRRPGLADLPRIGEALRKHQPVVTVFAQGDSLEEVEKELRSRVWAVQRLLALSLQ